MGSSGVESGTAEKAELAAPSNTSGRAVGDDAKCSMISPHGTPGLGAADTVGHSTMAGRTSAAVAADANDKRSLVRDTLPRLYDLDFRTGRVIPVTGLPDHGPVMPSGDGNVITDLRVCREY